MEKNEVLNLLNIINYTSNWGRELSYDAICLKYDGFEKIDNRANFIKTDNPKYHIAIIKNNYHEDDELSLIALELDADTNYEEMITSHTYDINIYELYEYICKNIPNLLYRFNPNGLFNSQYKCKLLQVKIECNKLVITTTENITFSFNIDKLSKNVYINRRNIYDLFNKIAFIFSDEDKNEIIDYINNHYALTKLSDKIQHIKMIDLFNSIECEDITLFNILSSMPIKSPSSRCYSFGYCEIDNDTLSVFGFIDNLSSGFRNVIFKINKYESITDNIDSFKWFLKNDVNKYLQLSDANSKSFIEFYKNYQFCGTAD